MNCIAIIQARMGSTRLPGKILMDIEGRTMLERIIERVSAAKAITQVVVATTTEEDDDTVAAFVQNMTTCGIYRGSVNDVLTRYYEAAVLFKADVVVRVTADDPLKDPGIIDLAVETLLADKQLDYCSNTLQPSYPEGLDIEVFHFSALEKAFSEAKLPSEREHVTPYIWKNPGIFNVRNFTYEKDLSAWRWTVDKPEDMAFMRRVFAEFNNNPLISYEEVIRFLEHNPEVVKINEGTIRNEGYAKSLSNENQLKN